MEGRYLKSPDFLDSAEIARILNTLYHAKVFEVLLQDVLLPHQILYQMIHKSSSKKISDHHNAL